MNYENIYTDNVENLKMVFKRFRKNMEEREKNQTKKLKSHETFTGPLFSVQCIVDSNFLPLTVFLIHWVPHSLSFIQNCNFFVPSIPLV